MVSRRQTILGDPGAVSWVGINGGERDITLNKPAPRLIRMLVSDWAQKNVFVPNRVQHLSCCFRDLFYPPTRLFAVYYLTCLDRAAELSSRRFSSENGAPKPKIPIIETNGKISVQPQHLLCKHVSTLLILTISEKK